MGRLVIGKPRFWYRNANFNFCLHLVHLQHRSYAYEALYLEMRHNGFITKVSPNFTITIYDCMPKQVCWMISKVGLLRFGAAFAHLVKHEFHPSASHLCFGTKFCTFDSEQYTMAALIPCSVDLYFGTNFCTYDPEQGTMPESTLCFVHLCFGTKFCTFVSEQNFRAESTPSLVHLFQFKNFHQILLPLFDR